MSLIQNKNRYKFWEEIFSLFTLLTFRPMFSTLLKSLILFFTIVPIELFHVSIDPYKIKDSKTLVVREAATKLTKRDSTIRQAIEKLGSMLSTGLFHGKTDE